ncbi:unnamed protein product [Arabidopsis arenosa]|uniref:Vesicle transport v-SNARE N-terminal domain-containing protein n=1 Tax=Arabidopsis arenosa TaxID=38785 RepID=A0A8S2AWD1_ARAAE|nr:unnamed protein product [Arabidopsis arenosa]
MDDILRKKKMKKEKVSTVFVGDARLVEEPNYKEFHGNNTRDSSLDIRRLKLMAEEIELVVNVDCFRIAEREAKYRSKSAQRKEGGLSSSYKNRLTEKGSSDGISCTYSSIRKFSVHRHARSCYILWCHRTRAFTGEKKWKITVIKSSLEEADVLIWKMDLEARSLQPSAKAVSADQRGRLAMSVKRLDQSRDRVREIRRLMLETEEVGISVFQDLNQQCQTLLHVHTKVVKIDGRVIGDGKVGRVTRTLQNAYKKDRGFWCANAYLPRTLKYKTRVYFQCETYRKPERIWLPGSYDTFGAALVCNMSSGSSYYCGSIKYAPD